MKRAGWLLALVLGLAGCGRARDEAARVPASPAQPVAAKQVAPVEERAPGQVAAYRVAEDLSDVANAAEFRRAGLLGAPQQAMLARNLFACTPTPAQQLFHVYENNDYLNIPSFVTVDLVLQLYHVYYDFLLRGVERDALLPALRKLTGGMLEQTMAMVTAAPEGRVRDAATRNAAYFGVAARLLGLKPALPADGARLADAEMALIGRHEGFATGAIFPYAIDYSQFAPRGHYTRSEDLKRYFGAMMWYGLAPFAARSPGGARLDTVMVQGILLARALRHGDLATQWDRVYGPTSFFVGASDDLTPEEYLRAADGVFGANAPLAALFNDAKLRQLADALARARPPRIRSEPKLEPNAPSPAPQLRFMGQRSIPDSELLQRLSKPIVRPVPSGMDVMAVLGSSRARELIDRNPDRFDTQRWDGYAPARAALASEFATVTAETWRSNLYWGWLYALRAVVAPFPEGYPSFMHGDAWLDRSISTALGSWAELRHDTILYGKQSAVECGDGEERPLPKGYVEPNVELYGRLLDLAKRTREGLSRRGLLSDSLRDRTEEFENLLAFLERVAHKELANEALTEEEYGEIRYVGGKVEYMTLSVMEGGPKYWHLVDETDRDMALIADVHTAAPVVLEAGVGHAVEILVVVPVEGKLQLARGAVFAYREFTQPMADRLTDAKWQAMLKAGKAPAPPFWTDSFLLAPRKPAPGSDRLETYSSGC
ncbi:MAG: DUF3160 domain-containing protein [Chthonomonadales bacterium]|nr:DUF3160 domain-containing protein [Chthonomonadales bacterium]